MCLPLLPRRCPDEKGKSRLGTAGGGRSNPGSFKIALKLRIPAWEQEQPQKQAPTPQPARASPRQAAGEPTRAWGAAPLCWAALGVPACLPDGQQNWVPVGLRLRSRRDGAPVPHEPHGPNPKASWSTSRLRSPASSAAQPSHSSFQHRHQPQGHQGIHDRGGTHPCLALSGHFLRAITALKRTLGACSAAQASGVIWRCAGQL